LPLQNGTESLSGSRSGRIGNNNMSDWHDFVSNDATPHGKRLLLITQPDTFDAVQKHI
jgi:hypothetical protein